VSNWTMTKFFNMVDKRADESRSMFLLPNEQFRD
jgi:hypothetical protein